MSRAAVSGRTALHGPIDRFIVRVFFLLLLTSLDAAASRYESQKSFGKTWHDGRAEVAAYKLEVLRYKEKRIGNAISIFVTEPFSQQRRIKIEDVSTVRSDDKVEVLKLNLVRDFPTGIYDYNTMLSVFVASEDAGKVNFGTPLKVSYSSQEWCGHVYQQLIPRDSFIESSTHSYFENEGDQRSKLAFPKDAIMADSLFHWARGFSGPMVSPGAKATRPLLNPVAHMRLAHKPALFTKATFHVSNETFEVNAAGRVWTTRLHFVASDSGQTFRFWVEIDHPRRIVKWEFTGAEGSDEKGELIGVERLAYWNQNAIKFQDLLTKIGLKPRDPLSP